MKKPGSKTKYSKELIKKAVKDYLSNEKSAEETASKYNLPAHVLLYHARKERKKDGAECG